MVYCAIKGVVNEISMKKKKNIYVDASDDADDD
jgi:hypothetical protein